MIKKIILTIVAIIVALVISAAGIFICEFSGVKQPVDGAVLNNNVITIKDGYVNVFLIQTSEKKAILIDAGKSEDAAPILNALSKRGMNADSVKAILLTHGHLDHIKGCQVFKKAEIYAMEGDVGIIEGTESMGLFTYDGNIKVTVALKHGDKVNIDGTRIETFALPGHSEGSVAYIINGVVFMGDSANATDENKIKQSVWFFSQDMDLNKASLIKLAKYLGPRADEIKALAFSHSGHLKGIEPLLEFAAGN